MAMESDDGSVFAITTAVISAVLKIAALVCVGMKLETQGMLNGPKRKCLSALAMDVCLPCLLFSDVLPQADEKLIYEGWQLLLWPLIYAVVGAFLGAVCCLLAGTPSQHLGSAAACAAFPNVNGFPVSIIAALGNTLPRSPSGFSAMVFLALIQLTDGIVKYTIGPAVFRRDLRAVQRARLREGHVDADDMPLGASLRTIESVTPEAIDLPLQPQTSDKNIIIGDPAHHLHPPMGRSGSHLTDKQTTEFGLVPEQYKSVEPDWSRFDSGKLVWSFSGRKLLDPDHKFPNQEVYNKLEKPLLESVIVESKLKRMTTKMVQKASGAGEFVRQLFPPQVMAVLLALALGIGPDWLKSILYDPGRKAINGPPPLGFIYGTAKQLGGGFVPLQMISLGGRLVKIAGSDGPLAAKGAAGPRGRTRLLRIGISVGIARMIIAPMVLFCIAVAIDRAFLYGTRPLAFWAPALIVAAMPTANNMSTMADLIGSGRSISAASTALQLLSSPFILALSLTGLIAGAQYKLAADFPDGS